MQNISYRYYSNAFPIYNRSTRPDDSIDFDEDEFCKILDFIFFRISSKLDENGYSMKFGLKQPSNIYLQKNDETLSLGIAWDKAIRGSNVLCWFNNYNSSMKNIAAKELGTRIDVILHISIDKLYEYKERWEMLFKTNDVLNVMPTMMSLETNRYLENHRVEPQNVDYKEVEKCIDKDNMFRDFLHSIYSEYEKQIEERLHILKVNPKFQASGLVVKENQCFYVLPFEDAPKSALKAIRDAVEKENIDCEIIKSEDRFDPTRGNNIVENIWQDICSSRFIIADLSMKNPNVYYELGICDAIGKTVIPICSKKSLEEDYPKGLPFDISQNYTVFYDENYEGYEELKSNVTKRIKAILNV